MISESYTSQKNRFQEKPKINPIQSVLRADKLCLLDPEINLTTIGEIFNGYNMFVLHQNNVSGITRNVQRSFYITNMEGDVLYVRKGFHSPITFINSTTLLLGGSINATLWNIFNNKTNDLGFAGHHDYEYNPVNHTFFTLHLYDIEFEGNVYRFDKILEFNATGHEVWSLDTRSFISESQWCPYQDVQANSRDITHSNSLSFDVDKGILYYHARNVNTFYKIDYKTKNVIWGLGEYGNFTLFDQNGNQRKNIFYHAHAVELIDDNTFILFDNDYHNQTNHLNERSRIVEITINETTMVAAVSWAWEAPHNYYSFYWGNADRLPNGNRFATFGTFKHPNTDIGARLVEVNNKGEIVWEMNFPPRNDTFFGVYRVDRFHFKPILDSPQDITAFSDNDLNVTWHSWYNYRSNVQKIGEYTLYLDEKPINNSMFIYNKFWQSKPLAFNLGRLELGIHNLTLAISDESGNIATDSIKILIQQQFRKSDTNAICSTSRTSNTTLKASIGLELLLSCLSIFYLIKITQFRRKD
ncbi:MAG: aryl-sulfate sulfotransferase [Candidatus Hodarchaeota archaeon]